MLDTPDAFHLPPVPGYGYLKVDTTGLHPVQGGLRLRPGARRAGAGRGVRHARPSRCCCRRTTGWAGPANGTDGRGRAGAARWSAAPWSSECVDAAAPRRTGAVRPIWLPPLPAAGSRSCRRRSAARAVTADCGATAAGADGAARRPDQAAAGPLAAGPQPGRRPRGGDRRPAVRADDVPADPGGLAGADPHAAAGRHLRAGPDRRRPLPRIEGCRTSAGWRPGRSRDRMRRLVEELLGMLAVRERVFADHGLDSLAMLRAEHAAGRIPELVSADVVLLLDGYGALRTDFEELEAPVGRAAAARRRLRHPRGAGHDPVERAADGPAVVVRHPDRAAAQRSGRLGGRPQAGRDHPARPARPGADRRRACSPRSPCRCARRSDDEVGEALEALAARDPAPAGTVRPPRRSGCCRPTWPRRACSGSSRAAPRCRSGCARTQMSVALLELGIRDQHLVAFGDAGSGKTTLLRGVVRGLVERVRPGRGGDRRAGPARGVGRLGAGDVPGRPRAYARRRPAACARPSPPSWSGGAPAEPRRGRASRGSCCWSTTTTCSRRRPSRCGRCCPTCPPPATWGCT